jgi:DNA (cytosine-5)-methyltransferase 1
MPTADYTLISLFTGAGGLDLGLEEAGFKTLLANEIDPDACETLRQNQILNRQDKSKFDAWFAEQTNQRCYKGVDPSTISQLRLRLLNTKNKKSYLEGTKILEKDIRDMTSKEVLKFAGKKRGDVDLIAGGPPCQPFSRAGKRESVKSATGRLFKEFVRIVADVRPRWFLFENVKGLIITKTPLAFVNCKDCKKDFATRFDDWERLHNEKVKTVKCYHCGSTKTNVTWENKAGGSLEIIKKEFESIGYKCSYKVLNAADFGAPQSRERLFIIGTRENENFTWPDPVYAKPTKDTENLLFDLEKLKPWRTMREALWPNGHWKYGKLGKEAVLWVKNVVRPHDEPVTWLLDRPSPTIGAHQGAKLALAPFGVPQAQIERQQWHTLGHRQGDTPPVNVEHEYLTDSELLTLQTFPDRWYLHGTRMERSFQIGNAVPPALACAIGRAIITAIRSKHKS